MARTPRGTSQEAVRRHNLSALLGHVHRHGPTPRAELTAALHLNRSTVADLVDELSRRGLVEEHDPAGPLTRGRPSRLVVARANRAVVLAVQLAVDTITVAVIGLGGQVRKRLQRELADASDREPGAVLAAVSRMASPTLRQLAPGTLLVGVGLAVPGIVQEADGRVLFAPNLGWHDVGLGAEVRRRLRLAVPVYVGNDADLGAVAEHVRGVATATDNLVYLNAEVGVGGGVITGGALLRGTAGCAAEVGHMQVNPNGVACRCGRRGCWETEVGEDALATSSGRQPGGGRAVAESVLRAAAAGEAAAQRGVHTVVEWLTVGVVNLVNMFNPEVVILGGIFAELHAVAGEQILAGLRDMALSPAHARVDLVVPQLGCDSILLGAAETAFAPLISDPTLAPFLPDVEGVAPRSPRTAAVD